jgi:hypothetical protein
VIVAGSILLLLIGAVLYLATHLNLAHVDLDTVAVILMAAGLLGVVLGLVQQAIWARRGRRAEVTADNGRRTDDPNSAP